MTRRILIVHYTPPGIIGGVEHIIEQHVRLFQTRGFAVEVVAGREGSSAAPVHVIPEIDVARPESVALEAALATGAVAPDFPRLREAIRDQLVPLAATADYLIAHNEFTLHFSLPLTAVLWDLAASRAPGTTIAWCHDLSWTNPLYISSMHDGYPWNLLRTPAPNTTYVAISEERRRELLGLWSDQPSAPPVAVVPNGVDVEDFFRLGDVSASIVREHNLFDRDVVILLPVRITRRKNIEAGIRAVASLRSRGLDACFVITGPAASHHPVRSQSYLQELKELAWVLRVQDHVIFLADERGQNLDHRTLSELYSVADVLLFPSAQEGFGLPILEAGLARVPVVLSDIPIFRELGAEDASLFGLDRDPDTIAERIAGALDTGPSRLYRRVLRQYRWDALMDKKILPILNGPTERSVSDRVRGTRA